MRIAFCVAVLCLIKISMVSSQLGHVSTRKCADFVLVPMDGFRKDLYIGDWFMHQVYDLIGSQQYNCYIVITTPNPNGSLNVTEVLINQVPKLRFEGVVTFSEDMKGYATYTSRDNPEYNNEYYILDSDYVTYTIEASCQDVDGGSIQQLYIKSRTPVVTPLTQTRINDVITNSKLDKSAIRTLNIQSCPAELTGNSGGLLAGLVALVTRLLGGLLGGILG